MQVPRKQFKSSFTLGAISDASVLEMPSSCCDNTRSMHSEKYQVKHRSTLNVVVFGWFLIKHLLASKNEPAREKFK